ncbi:hypothetical protein Pfo_006770 [Paulownia fortunei]|nr:hypothetical protein Pfo_006770 [Paulownia fortunei]
MADPRVYPTTANTHPPPPSSSSAATSPKHSGEHPKPPNPQPSKPVPPPATYVVQLPREQILRYPPPENARKFQTLTRRRNRRSCCRRCCCFTFCLLVLLYTVTNLAIKGMNLTSAAPVSPGFDVTIRAENPNGKVGIYYLKDSTVNVFYNDMKLSDGVLPAFYQPRKNVTVLQTALTGSDVILVPFVVKTKVPVKIEVGSVKTWKITVKVKCDVVVDALNEMAKIMSKDCDYSVRLW